MPSRPQYSALDQLDLLHDRISTVLEQEVRRRRPFDTAAQQLEIACHSWIHLAEHCTCHPYPVSWDRLVRHAVAAVRRGVREHQAYVHELPVNAYGRYVSLRQVEGVGRGFWPAGTGPADFADVFNTSGDDAEVERRRSQGRSITADDAERLYSWVVRRATEVVDEVMAFASGLEPSTVVACIDALGNLSRSSSPGTCRLARRYSIELRTALHAGCPPPDLTGIAHEIGLTGGTADRALEQVRRAVRGALDA